MKRGGRSYLLVVFLLVDVATHRVQVVVCLGLIVLATVVRVIAPLGEPALPALADGALVACGLVSLSLAIRRLLRSRRVTPALICGAVSVYLLAGVTWAIGYHGLETLWPRSFAISGGERSASPGDLYYFSFVTITTLGYGDVSPQSGLAKSVSVLEAVFGQVFLVVLLGRLVSLQIALPVELPERHPGDFAQSDTLGGETR